MNGIEKIAYRNIYHAINNIVGLHYNTIQDNLDPDWLPKSMDALKEEIYDSAMNNLYAPGYEGYGKAPKEMRFSGEAFIRKTIDKILASDEVAYDVAEIAEYANWEEVG